MLRMGVRQARAARVVLVGGLGLLLWQLATASPGASLPPPAGEARAAEASGAPPDARPAPQARPSEADPGRPPGTRSGVAGAQAGPPGPASSGASRERPGSGGGPAASLLVTSLPPASSELLPDGLPASGLRCDVDGGVLSCGSCRTDGDCPRGQGCVANRESRRLECMASECEEDAHCFPGFLCRAVTTGATGAVIRRCAPEGLRSEGEPCDGVPLSSGGSCREGLRCVRGRCGTPCRPEVPSSCPAGHVCEDTREGPACSPDCRAAGCPEGQRCKGLGDAGYQCLAAVRGECPEVPCAEGERCNMRLSRGRGVFWCARVCQPLDLDGCPPGQVCGVGSATLSTCYRRCEPTEPERCGEGWACASVSEDMTLWGCRPVTGP